LESKLTGWVLGLWDGVFLAPPRSQHSLRLNAEVDYKLVAKVYRGLCADARWPNG
jgi:hypothetical protein